MYVLEMVKSIYVKNELPVKKNMEMVRFTNLGIISSILTN